MKKKFLSFVMVISSFIVFLSVGSIFGIALALAEMEDLGFIENVRDYRYLTDEPTILIITFALIMIIALYLDFKGSHKKGETRLKQIMGDAGGLIIGLDHNGEVWQYRPLDSTWKKKSMKVYEDDENRGKDEGRA